MNRPTFARLAFILFFLALVALSDSSYLTAEDNTSKEPSFLPIWQMMGHSQKEQFVAGYVQAMKDAAKMTDVLSTFVHDNPSSAGDSLSKLKSIYSNIGESKPDLVASGIDTFYNSPKNREAPLSRAITGAITNAQ